MQAHPALVLNADFRPLSGRPSYWRRNERSRQTICMRRGSKTPRIVCGQFELGPCPPNFPIGKMGKAAGRS